MDTTLCTLDALDVEVIATVNMALREINNIDNVRLNRVEVTVYDEHRLTFTRRSKWSPFCLTKIKKVAR